MESITVIEFVLCAFLFSLTIAFNIWVFKKQPFVGLLLAVGLIYLTLQNEFVQGFLENLNLL